MMINKQMNKPVSIEQALHAACGGLDDRAAFLNYVVIDRGEALRLRADAVLHALAWFGERVADDGLVQLYGGAFVFRLLRAIFGGAFDDALFGVWRRRRFLLHGETGTGKERLAQLIGGCCIRLGPFPSKSVHALNLAAVPETLAESMLFGHVAGAFTDGRKSAKGVIVHAGDFAALFLDEVGAVTPQVQAKLLRFLESDEVLPVGAEKALYVNLHVIAATSSTLAELRGSAQIRADLYHRLSSTTIAVPPLRDLLQSAERPNALWEVLVQRAALELAPDPQARIQPDPKSGAVEDLRVGQRREALIASLALPANLLMLHEATRDAPWRGNLREAVAFLVRLTETAIARPEGPLESMGALARRLLAEDGQVAPTAFPTTLPCQLDRILEQIELEYYAQAFATTQGNTRKVAAALGVDYQVALRKLTQFGHRKERRRADRTAPGLVSVRGDSGAPLRDDAPA